VERDFGPVARGEEPSEDLLVFEDGDPVGLVQRSRYGAYPEYIEELAPTLAVDGEAVTVDYFVGDPDRCGRGLGPRIIAAVVAESWTVYPDAPAVVVPVNAANRASWRALEKAGFTRVAEGELEPDNPVDDRHHVVYRVDRPTT
jgi:aminoglycoside 6'-N-acetyltransferase